MRQSNNKEAGVETENNRKKIRKQNRLKMMEKRIKNAE